MFLIVPFGNYDGKILHGNTHTYINFSRSIKHTSSQELVICMPLENYSRRNRYALEMLEQFIMHRSSPDEFELYFVRLV